MAHHRSVRQGRKPHLSFHLRCSPRQRSCSIWPIVRYNPGTSPEVDIAFWHPATGLGSCCKPLFQSGWPGARVFGELEKLVLVLRDGRKLIGVLRSWDQFGQFTSRGLLAIVLAWYHWIGREGKTARSGRYMVLANFLAGGCHLQQTLFCKIRSSDFTLRIYMPICRVVYIWFGGRMCWCSGRLYVSAMISFPYGLQIPVTILISSYDHMVCYWSPPSLFNRTSIKKISSHRRFAKHRTQKCLRWRNKKRMTGNKAISAEMERCRISGLRQSTVVRCCSDPIYILHMKRPAVQIWRCVVTVRMRS